MKIVRFAPSPTGYLHIGSARTALFNYLFAKKNNAKFILRIEDTDRERSTKEAVDAILNGLKMLEINYDELFFQSERIERHKEVAYCLLEKGLAYYDEDKEKGKAIRIKIPKNEEIKFKDHIRGEISFNSNDIEDYVLLRSDGTPTYMLSVVVDDIDMKITDIIRGDDHIGNTPKQILLYKAMEKTIPNFAHIPLIHDEDGNKLSKRKNATAVEDYENMGFLPEAIFNYLLHLGGGYTKDIISKEEAINNFEITKIGKSPSRLDFDKLNFINLEYIKNLSDEKIQKKTIELLRKDYNININEEEEKRIKIIIPELKKISNFTKIKELAFVFTNHFDLKIHKTEELEIEEDVSKFKNYLKENLENLDLENLIENIKEFSKNNNISIKAIYQTIRYSTIGKIHSISVKLILEALKKEETKKRIGKFLKE